MSAIKKKRLYEASALEAAVNNIKSRNHQYYLGKKKKNWFSGVPICLNVAFH